MQRIVCLVIAAALGIVTISVALADSPAPAAAKAGEAKELFNGKDLEGWDGDPAYWSVEDSVITGRTTPEKKLKHNNFLIWKGGTLKDFELRVKYKIANGNSGVQYRSTDDGDHRVSGYQADIVGGDNDKFSGILYEENRRGILAQRGQKVVIDAEGKKNVVGSVGESDEIAKAIKKGDWNEYTITAKGNHLTQQINGVTTVDVTDEQTAKAAREGILALQMHVGDPMVIQFKDIKLTELKQ
ncbi:MAG: hypothetical protein QOF78_4540 [Phycisphaerales bacterium]|jgi:hypothetical protein|nr:hypothetical protein [Phycisphaerales bacterium]